MVTALLIAGVIAIYWVLAYREARLYWWIIATVGIVAVLSASMQLPVTLLGVIIVIALLFIIIWGTSTVRQKLISRPLLNQFKRVLPPLSQTEQEALDAGTVWWDAELFSGRPDWQKLKTIPDPDLTDDERAFFDGPVAELVDMLDPESEAVMAAMEDERHESGKEFKRSLVITNGISAARMLIEKNQGDDLQELKDALTRLAAADLKAVITVKAKDALELFERMRDEG